MKVLVTGSSGHLGEGLVRVLGRHPGNEVASLDLSPSPFTSVTGSVCDRGLVDELMPGVEVVYHTATLHKPHVGTHTAQQFVDTNVSGTLALLEAAVEHGVKAFVFTSTTSVFGDAMRPVAGEPAAWVTEATVPSPKNIYGVTKLSAEALCQLYHRNHGLKCVVLRTSRFFLELDDDPSVRGQFPDANIKTNEYLYRRVDLEDAVDAHLKAAAKAPEIGFGRYIVSATTPFLAEDAARLNIDAPEVAGNRVPEFRDVYAARGWRMFGRIDRVYVNDAARADLGWAPRFDFRRALEQVRTGGQPASRLAAAVGTKGYHETPFEDGPYPVVD